MFTGLSPRDLLDPELDDVTDALVGRYEAHLEQVKAEKDRADRDAFLEKVRGAL